MAVTDEAKLLNMVNEINEQFLKKSDLNPIKFDGLRCPKCEARTVHWMGKIWCPSFSCDFGEAPTVELMTKWI